MNRKIYVAVMVMSLLVAGCAGFYASAKVAKSRKGRTAKSRTAMVSNQKKEMKQTEEKPLENVTVAFETTAGPITIRLYDDTPKHRDNFVKLVKEGFYNGVLFHRVIKDFMVQTGDPSSREAKAGAELGAGDPGYTIDAEILYPKHYHKYGAVAAARTGDAFNPERRSSGSQFYIVTGTKFNEQDLSRYAESGVMQRRQTLFRQLCDERADTIRAMMDRNDKVAMDSLRDELVKRVESEIPSEPLPANILNDYTTIGGTPHLDGQYTVFGEVVDGMDTVEKIQNAATGSGDRPVEDIRVIKAEIVSPKAK